MKKLLLYLFIVIVAVFSWSPAMAQCSDATFRCKDASGNQLGIVSISCSIQQPLLQEFPRCLPNFDLFSPCPTLQLCKNTYPSTSEACPLQPWPSAWRFSSCINRCY